MGKKAHTPARINDTGIPTSHATDTFYQRTDRGKQRTLFLKSNVGGCGEVTKTKVNNNYLIRRFTYLHQQDVIANSIEVSQPTPCLLLEIYEYVS